ncbi:MAG: hypothetical protein SFV51_00205 [Bryobacteraceae bacterium]|nr:hypothetical protein [Bryobacteraceae bacterium]
MHRWLVWNVLFRLQEKIKGHPTLRILREMEMADRMSPAALAEAQRQRLSEFIGYCHTHVPYVRDLMKQLGIRPEEIQGPEDLRRFPVMTKAAIRNHRAQLRSENARNLTARATGGSTGDPLIFDVSRRRIASQVACRQRVSRWWGLSVGDAEIALWGSPVETSRQDRIRDLRDRMMATRLLPAFEMNEAAMSGYLDILQAQGCRQIFAYPSAIYLLCLHARKQNRPLRNARVRTVFVTGEVLYPHQRELISEVLGCPVANGYGGRDSGFIAHECPNGEMHIMADAVIVELLDAQGRPAAPGESGEIVVTDLYSHEAPFLRYATGDMAVAADRPCACGRPLPLIERIEGRANDTVITPDGRVINSLALIYPVREIEGVEQFRIRQKQPDRFEVQLVRNRSFPPDAEGRIVTAWSLLLRAPVQVSFEYPAELTAERSGKFRHVISDLTSVQPARSS